MDSNICSILFSASTVPMAVFAVPFIASAVLLAVFAIPFIVWAVPFTAQLFCWLYFLSQLYLSLGQLFPHAVNHFPICTKFIRSAVSPCCQPFPHLYKIHYVSCFPRLSTISAFVQNSLGQLFPKAVNHFRICTKFTRSAVSQGCQPFPHLYKIH